MKNITTTEQSLDKYWSRVKIKSIYPHTFKKCTHCGFEYKNETMFLFQERNSGFSIYGCKHCFESAFDFENFLVGKELLLSELQERTIRNFYCLPKYERGENKALEKQVKRICEKYNIDNESENESEKWDKFHCIFLIVFILFAILTVVFMFLQLFLLLYISSAIIITMSILFGLKFILTMLLSLRIEQKATQSRENGENACFLGNQQALDSTA